MNDVIYTIIGVLHVLMLAVAVAGIKASLQRRQR